MKYVQLKNTLVQSFKKMKGKLHLEMALKLLFTVFLVSFNFYAAAQSTTTTLPQMDLGGASQQTSPLDMVIVAFKALVAVALWIISAIAGYKTVAEILKSAHKSKRDEEFKWGQVMGDIIGHVVIFILVLIMAIWMTSTFTQ